VSTRARASLFVGLLTRLGLRRDPDLWTVRCRDERGRRAHLQVRLTAEGVTLVSSSPGPWPLTPLEVGRLREALRDALFASVRLVT
jgi:hypothetical protein